jgi:predicted nuclease of predicted toxin-antitoxin system
MKLLFDENLSPKLPGLVAGVFLDSSHVRACGLRGGADDAVWDYARSNGFAVISKDSDFHQRSLLYGHPPKVVWLRVGNCTTRWLTQLIIGREQEIRAFGATAIESVLVISP